MTISTPSVTSLPRRSARRTPSIRPVPKPAANPPLVYGRAAQRFIEVEGDLFNASAELVKQRADLAEAASPEDNRLMRKALRALDNDDVAFARELLRTALFLADNQDTAALRAEQRRANAHGYQKIAVGRVDSALTGREHEMPAELGWPLSREGQP